MQLKCNNFCEIHSEFHDLNNNFCLSYLRSSIISSLMVLIISKNTEWNALEQRFNSCRIIWTISSRLLLSFGAQIRVIRCWIKYDYSIVSLSTHVITAFTKIFLFDRSVKSLRRFNWRATRFSLNFSISRMTSQINNSEVDI